MRSLPLATSRPANLSRFFDPSFAAACGERVAKWSGVDAAAARDAACEGEGVVRWRFGAVARLVGRVACPA